MGWLIPLFFQVINLSGYSFYCIWDLYKRSTGKQLWLNELSILCASGVRLSSSPKGGLDFEWLQDKHPFPIFYTFI